MGEILEVSWAEAFELIESFLHPTYLPRMMSGRKLQVSNSPYALALARLPPAQSIMDSGEHSGQYHEISNHETTLRHDAIASDENREQLSC